VDGQLTLTPFTTAQRLSLRGDPAGAPAIEIPKDWDQKIITHIETLAVDKFKGTLPKPPEKYNMKIPEKSMLSVDVLEKTATIARELGLSKDAQAQRLVDFLHGETEVLTTVAKKEFDDQVKQWEGLVLSAPDLGNGNPKMMSAIVARVSKLTQKFFPEGARKMMDEHGLGSHPDFIRGLSRIADLAKEDVIEMGSISGVKKSHAESIYPSGDKK
jgi:hypothetical protein